METRLIYPYVQQPYQPVKLDGVIPEQTLSPYICTYLTFVHKPLPSSLMFSDTIFFQTDCCTQCTGLCDMKDILYVCWLQKSARQRCLNRQHYMQTFNGDTTGFLPTLDILPKQADFVVFLTQISTVYLKQVLDIRKCASWKFHISHNKNT